MKWQLPLSLQGCFKIYSNLLGTQNQNWEAVTAAHNSIEWELLTRNIDIQDVRHWIFCFARIFCFTTPRFLPTRGVINYPHSSKMDHCTTLKPSILSSHQMVGFAQKNYEVKASKVGFINYCHSWCMVPFDIKTQGKPPLTSLPTSLESPRA